MMNNKIIIIKISSVINDTTAKLASILTDKNGVNLVFHSDEECEDYIDNNYEPNYYYVYVNINPEDYEEVSRIESQANLN